METVSLCFSIGSQYTSRDAATPGNDIAVLEETYQKAHKKIIAFFYNHPQFPFSWTFSGVQLAYYAEKHPEFTDTLAELVARKQLELIGGGYYEPVFPLLTSADCIAQIELLTTLQHSLIGPRPRGIALSDFWSPRLITPFRKCKMDFVQIDVSLIADRTHNFQPLIVENLGKTISVLPVYPDLLPELTQKPQTYFLRLLKIFSRVSKTEPKNPVAVCSFSPDELVSFIESDWLEEFFSISASYTQQIQLTTPSHFFTKSTVFLPAYIPPTQSYIHTNDDLRLLYARMVHACLIVSQCRGDKARKKAAHEKLLEAQSGKAYLPGAQNEQHRRTAYHNLIQAEKIARDQENSTGSVTSFDFAFNGINDYICRFSSYNAFISKKGGAVFELDVFQNALNYAGKCFVDILSTSDDFENIAHGSQTAENVFADQHYSELLFDRARKEIRLEVSATFGEQKQHVVLKKNYRAYDHGLQVQYILKNKSELPLHAVFAVESLLAIPEDRKTEIITDQGSEILNSSKHYMKKRNVSYVQITDVLNNVSFVTEPNEKSGFVHNPATSSTIPAINSIHFWNITLESEKEMEKTLNLTIITPKKRLKK
jgi:hypothetical protein